MKVSVLSVPAYKQKEITGDVDVLFFSPVKFKSGATTSSVTRKWHFQPHLMFTVLLFLVFYFII